MSWLTGSRGANTYICPEDKYVAKSNNEFPWEYALGIRSGAQNSFNCPYCGLSLINMGTRWRAPKKRDNKAWQKIATGNIWWNTKLIKESSKYDNAHTSKRFAKQMTERQ